MNSGPNNMIINFNQQKWYFITSSVKKRKYIFCNSFIRKICFNSFLQTALDHNYFIAAFIIMPDHFHILSGSNDILISKEKMAKNYKGAASRRIFLSTQNLKLDLKSLHFWTDGCDKKEINNFFIFRVIQKYIILNPLKKRLPPTCYSLFVNLKFSGPEFIQGTENILLRMNSRLKNNDKKLIFKINSPGF